MKTLALALLLGLGMFVGCEGDKPVKKDTGKSTVVTPAKDTVVTPAKPDAPKTEEKK